ncbi:MAG: RNB domain-containing ribonuclease [Deltaproteobacteria bacterium]|nr:RNB domain-containing ribonuclease [Deltaproteobacteria bacterium]
MNQGKIVEYIEEGNVISSLCLHEDGNRLHLLTPSNREINLSPKRALLISAATINTVSPREELLSRLKKTEEKRIRLQGEVRVKELWELIRDEKEVFDARYLAELCFGEKVSDDHVSGLVRALFDDKLHFKLKDGRFLPNSEERVEQLLREREEAALRERRLLEGSRWLRQVMDGGGAEGHSCEEDVIGVLVDLGLYREDAPDFRSGKELLSRAGISDLDEVRSILVRLGVWEEDENLDLLRLRVKTHFDEEDLTQCARVARFEPGGEERRDLRGLSAMTIDGPLTRDFDDALSVEIHDGIIDLGVHISDVAGAIPPGSPLDLCAKERGTSLYLTRRQIPMIPQPLSQDALSLMQDTDRPALSLLCRLDREGNLLEWHFVRSLIRVKSQLTYEQVNERYLEDGLLGELHRLGRVMRLKRIEQGALLLSLPEVYVNVSEEGDVSVRLLPQETPSRMIVEEMMILYNWLAARFCRDRRVPVLYRCQQAPSEVLARNESNGLYSLLKQRGKLSPLEIRTAPKPHSGLGLDVYTNVSSPIRRYFDLVIQRQIGSSLSGAVPPYTTEDLEGIRLSLESMLRELEKMKRNRLRYWILKHLLQHTGETFPALVLGVGKSKYRIVLTDFLLITEMKRLEGQSLVEGQRITVRVRKSDPWNDTLRMEYVGPA